MNQYLFSAYVEGIDTPINVIGIANNECYARKAAKEELIKKFNGQPCNILNMIKIKNIKR